MARHAVVYGLRERHPVHREGGAARHARGVGRLEHDAPQPPHLGLQQAMGVRELDRLEGVTADELGQAAGLVRRRHLDGAHLVQRDRDASPGERPGSLAAREPAPHHRRTEGHGMACAYVATDSAGAASSTVISCPHLRHLREIPLVLVCFSSIPTNPQLGQATATGRFHVE